MGLHLTSLCDLPLLFVYFQVNNGVLYFLDYVEDIYIMDLSAIVSKPLWYLRGLNRRSTDC